MARQDSQPVEHATTYPSVAILLCTYNGSRFLAQQLDSIFQQKAVNCSIWVSDDGSHDGTLDMLKCYQSIWGQDRFTLLVGPGQGFSANFMSLICNADIQADYFAYADQDDIWAPNKLSHAISQCVCTAADVPTLYCARTALIDAQGNEVGLSPLFNKSPSFANALVQSIGGGNTMVMNQSARAELLMAGQRSIVSHDWWTYMLISGVGGTVLYDAQPMVEYRQHAGNLIGSNTSWSGRLYRISMLLKNRFAQWNTINSQALQDVRDQLTPENQRILDVFCQMRNRWLLSRIWNLWQLGLYRQTRLGQLGLMAAVLLKKI